MGPNQAFCLSIPFEAQMIRFQVSLIGCRSKEPPTRQLLTQSEMPRLDCTIAAGDLFMLSTKNLIPESYQGARKLTLKYSGPNKVIEAITPVTFRLDLPPALQDRKVHRAFHSSVLKSYVQDTLFDGQRTTPQPITLSDCGIILWEPKRKWDRPPDLA